VRAFHASASFIYIGGYLLVDHWNYHHCKSYNKINIDQFLRAATIRISDTAYDRNNSKIHRFACDEKVTTNPLLQYCPEGNLISFFFAGIEVCSEPLPFPAVSNNSVGYEVCTV
jgi:hypothetical protein